MTVVDKFLLGSTAKQIGVVLEPMVRLFIRTVPPGWADGVSGTYLDLLSDIPPDLLARGVREAMTYCDFFPSPGRVRQYIVAELRERRDTRRRLDAALAFARRQQQRRAA